MTMTLTCKNCGSTNITISHSCCLPYVCDNCGPLKSYKIAKVITND